VFKSYQQISKRLHLAVIISNNSEALLISSRKNLADCKASIYRWLNTFSFGIWWKKLSFPIPEFRSTLLSDTFKFHRNIWVKVVPIISKSAIWDRYLNQMTWVLKLSLQLFFLLGAITVKKIKKCIPNLGSNNYIWCRWDVDLRTDVTLK